MDRHVFAVICGKFFLDLVGVSFFILLNFFFTEKAYQDFEAASFFKYRFAAVMLLGIPFGLLIKGRKLRNFFLMGAIITPISALLTLYAIDIRYDFLIMVSMFFLGVGFTFVQVSALPYVVLNTKKEKHSESIALLYLTWVVSGLVAGGLNYAGNLIAPDLFTIKFLLTISSLLGCIAFPIFLLNTKEETISEKVPFRNTFSNYDWLPIAKVTFPTLLIAVGAGFSIPFMNLFFEYVHGMHFSHYSLLVFSTNFLVVFAVLLIPTVKKNYGYHIAITLMQSIGIFCLVMLAFTEYYKEMFFAIWIAGLLFVMRQPMMSVAGPMTSELSLYIVGKKNQELIAAIQASIWNGCWFISSFLFTIFRKSGLAYSTIFLLTAVLYVFGVCGGLI